MTKYNSYEELSEQYNGDREIEVGNVKFRLHHRSRLRGYQTVYCSSVVDYKGRFGEGIAIMTHDSQSTNYHIHSYYIKVK